MAFVGKTARHDDLTLSQKLKGQPSKEVSSKVTTPRKRAPASRKLATNLTKEGLAREVANVLELPHLERRGTAYKAVKVIIKAITEALLRGEAVKIDGFGIFRAHERPPTRKLAYFYPYLKTKGLHAEILNVPAKKRIIFTPSTALTRYINEPRG